MKYWSIYKIFLKNAVSYEAQYRHDTWLHIVTNALWIAVIITTIEIIFGQTKEIVGWSKPEVYLLSIVYIIMDEIYTLFFKKNMLNLSEIITLGELDLMLTKPAHALFLATTRIVLVRSLFRMCIHIGLLTWALWHWQFSFSPYYIPIAIILVLCGVIVEYSFLLLLNTLGFWFLRFDNINSLWDILSVMGRYPISVLPKFIKLIILTIVPIAFIGYIPTATLLGKWPIQSILYSLGFTAMIFILAIQFWNFAVRRYSSASS